MDLRQLRYFVAVAEAGHMTRAAAQLGMQQPPLSLQIRALESRLGLTLFQRHPKGVRLTDAGQVFLEEVRRILQEVHAMQQRMRSLAQGQRGTLRVAFTSSAAAHGFTPTLLSACRRRHADIELVLSEANAAEITEAVAASRLHVGLLRVPVAHPEGVTLHTLLREPALLAMPVDHPLAGARGTRRSVPLQSLDGQDLILVRRPGAPGLYANLLTLCARAGVKPKIVAEVDRMMTNLNLVAAGVGLSVVPASMKGSHAHAVVYRPFCAPVRLDAPLTLAYREADCTGATRTFVDLARELAQAAARPAHAPAQRRARTGARERSA